MSELQAGMLALVVGTTGHRPETLGMIIEIESVGHGVAYWTLKGERVNTRLNHLLPIKPEADPLDVTHKEELHA